MQGFINGGGEYAKRILQEIIIRQNNIKIYGLFDSKIKFIGNDEDYYNSISIKLLDVQKKNIATYISEFSIDIFFIGIAQNYLSYDFCGIKCKTVIIIHDIGTIESAFNNIFFHYSPSIRKWVKLNLSYLFRSSKFSWGNHSKNLFSAFIKYAQQDNVQIITVSNYTLGSLKYYFPELENKEIRIFYPPEKLHDNIDNPINPTIKHLIESSIKYLLILSTDRENKNAKILNNVFQIINGKYPQFYLVSTGNLYKTERNTISLGYISDSDMEILYKNAYALVYPSTTEGFGYPPLEAMKYGVPVLSSNVCSMPEVLSDSVIYFSPFYENDLYDKLIYLFNNYEEYSMRARKRYDIVNQRQRKDLNELVDYILESDIESIID